MRRNWNLIRALLMTLTGETVIVSGYSKEQIREHQRLMIEGGLAEIDDGDDESTPIVRISDEGRDFLSWAQDARTWAIVEDLIARKDLPAVLEVMQLAAEKADKSNGFAPPTPSPDGSIPAGYGYLRFRWDMNLTPAAQQELGFVPSFSYVVLCDGEPLPADLVVARLKELEARKKADEHMPILERAAGEFARLVEDHPDTPLPVLYEEAVIAATAAGIDRLMLEGKDGPAGG